MPACETVTVPQQQSLTETVTKRCLGYRAVKTERPQAMKPGLRKPSCDFP